MNRDEILAKSSMPLISPSYPRGPYRFINREYLLITYECDPAIIRAAVPEPLVPVGNTVVFEFMKMPDSSGFGDYSEAGTVIPCTFNGTPCNYTVQMYLDDDAPIAGGREIWGFPKKYAFPKLSLNGDTLTGTLHYAEQMVAMGTMAYKYEDHTDDHGETLHKLTTMGVNMKLIPDVDGRPKVAQLVGYTMTNVVVHGSWTGPARLHLIPHINAPVADFPVGKILGGRHILADMTLPFGHVLYDYLV